MHCGLIVAPRTVRSLLVLFITKESSSAIVPKKIEIFVKSQSLRPSSTWPAHPRGRVADVWRRRYNSSIWIRAGACTRPFPVFYAFGTGRSSFTFHRRPSAFRRAPPPTQRRRLPAAPRPASAMESREEIQEMRVHDLRDFLKRHGRVPTTVTRLDGTPGPPRKADLLRAALEVEKASREGVALLESHPSLEPYARSPEQQAQVPNPFQSARSPPQPSRRSMGSARRASVTVPPAPAQTAPASESPAALAPARRDKARRKSATWIDPQLLAALSTPKKKSAPAVPAPADPPPPETIRPSIAQRKQMRASVPVEKPVAPAPAPPQRKSTAAVMQQRRLSQPEQPRSGLAGAQRAVPMQAGRRVADDPPPRPLQTRDVRRGAQATEAVPFSRAVLPEEDEEDGPAMFDEEAVTASYDVDEEVPDNQLFDEAALEQDRHDILVHSDYEPSAGESDFDSTVETDEEPGQRPFSAWTTVELKRWLSRNGVPFSSMHSKSALVGLARAHELQMETTADQNAERLRRQQDLSSTVVGEDEITPVVGTGSTAKASTGRSSRRRRVISAPAADEEDEDDGALADYSREGRIKNRFDVDEFAAKQRGARKRKKQPRKEPRRILVSLVPLRSSFLLVAFIVIAGAALWSFFWAWEELNKPFCDSEDQSKLLEAFRTLYNFLGSLTAWNQSTPAEGWRSRR